jgi:hypothetical protein
VKLFLDDVRQPPDSTWAVVKTVAAAIEVMESGKVSEASLDDDLGTDEHGRELPKGRTLVSWMAEHDCWPAQAITVHSFNVGGVEYMLDIIGRHAPFTRVGSTDSFVRRRDALSMEADD